jgi:hypothetical protein
MKIKVLDLINLFIGYNFVNKVNTRMSTRFTYSMHKNLPLLQKEIDFWNEITQEQREEIRDVEIEIDLHKIMQDDLPEYVPTFEGISGLDIFSPILTDYQKQEAPEFSALSRLLNQQETEVTEPKNKNMKKV